MTNPYIENLGMLDTDYAAMLAAQSANNSNSAIDDSELWEPEGASYYNGELILHSSALLSL